MHVSHMCGIWMCEGELSEREWGSAEIWEETLRTVHVSERFQIFSSDLHRILFHKSCQEQYGEEDLNAWSSFDLV